jgi:hypothetical protein
MRAIQKVTTNELLIKQAMRIKNIIYKNMYILRYFSEQSPPELRHLSYWGIRFSTPVPKKSAVCELSLVMYCDTKKNCTGSFRTKGMEC